MYLNTDLNTYISKDRRIKDRQMKISIQIVITEKSINKDLGAKTNKISLDQIM